MAVFRNFEISLFIINKNVLRRNKVIFAFREFIRNLFTP